MASSPSSSKQQDQQRNNNDDNHNLTIPSADVLRLIQAHLTEAGLHKTVQTLQEESGVGMAGSVVLPNTWYAWAIEGQWADILKSLSMLDQQRSRLDLDLLAAVHEQSILELADAGDLGLAYAAYRMVQSELEDSMFNESIDLKLSNMSRARILEQQLAALANSRTKDPKVAVPTDYYGAKGRTKKQRRQHLGRKLQETIPHQPKGRLTSLLQQSIKWQTYAGKMPKIRQWWPEEEENTTAPPDDDDTASTRKKKKKKRKHKHFDLVLGEVNLDPLTVGETIEEDQVPNEPIPSEPYATIKFGKKATAETAIFLPDGSGLVTGSSDGLIEIWDPAAQYKELRMDLPYQQNDDLLGHDCTVTALAVSNDGTMLASGASDGKVKVWRLDTGKCLRVIQAYERGGKSANVSCLALSPDASHLLAGGHGGMCREFGMRTSRLLKEFTGHTSYVLSCAYVMLSSGVVVVITSAADGTVRLWNAKTFEVLRVLRPVSLGPPSLLSGVGSSVMVNQPQESTSSDAIVETSSPAIHTVLSLHTPANTMIIVPRGIRAFLVNYQGAVLRVFEGGGGLTSEKVFVAAAISSSNRWFYAVQDNGVCCVFDVTTGQLETVIADLGLHTTSKAKDSSGGGNSSQQQGVAEISALFHHPNKSILGAFSNDKGQKKGQVVLWK